MISNQNLATQNHVLSMEHTVNGVHTDHAQLHVELARRAEFEFATAPALQMVDEHAVILVMQKKRNHANFENVQLMVVTANGETIVDARSLVEPVLIFVSDFALIHLHNTVEKIAKDQTIKSKNATLTHAQFTENFHFGPNGNRAQSAVEEVFSSVGELVPTLLLITGETIVTDHANHRRCATHKNARSMVASLNGLLSENVQNHAQAEPNPVHEHVPTHLLNTGVRHAQDR